MLGLAGIEGLIAFIGLASFIHSLLFLERKWSFTGIKGYIITLLFIADPFGSLGPDFLLVVQGLINKFDFLFLIMDLCLASLVMHLFLINALTDFTPGLRSIFLLGLFFLII